VKELVPDPTLYGTSAIVVGAITVAAEQSELSTRLKSFKTGELGPVN
jgi:hypothetical protein